MATATDAPIATGTWKLDPVHSRAGFRVKHFSIAWLRGTFGAIDMTVTSAADGSLALDGSAAADSVGFTNEKLVAHLLSPDFFDAQLHPRIEFRSRDIDLVPGGDALVRGELTMKGVTKPIELRGAWSGPIEDISGNQRIGLELGGEIDRSDFGVSWTASLPGGGDVVGRTVRLEGEFELVQE